MQLYSLITIVALLALNIWLWRTHKKWQAGRRNPIDVAPPCEADCLTCASLDGAARDYETDSFSDKLR